MFGTAGLCASRPTGIHLLTLSCAALLFLHAGCSGKSNAKNSECFYDRVDTHAEVTALKPHPEGMGRIAVILDFKASTLALEDQELGELKDIKIDHDFLLRNNIEIGNHYEVVVSELTKGDCENKLIVAFNHAFE